ncbi:hypothetical protein NO1_0023 [Candidatus Termititenax aidoneus]|uniref:Uncharacterized protein n=1 Tax=Termititenax aidoneus TaxID=2218524 RepID=A0A388T714_TERA1|nr:hypothetical protein NO1_0023 [Candidatus Termititenax aidoneus]
MFTIMARPTATSSRGGSTWRIGGEINVYNYGTTDSDLKSRREYLAHWRQVYFLPKEGISMKANFVVREKNIMAEIKPQILSMEDIVRQQELAKYGRSTAAAKPKAPVIEGCLMPATRNNKK